MKAYSILLPLCLSILIQIWKKERNTVIIQSNVFTELKSVVKENVVLFGCLCVSLTSSSVCIRVWVSGPVWVPFSTQVSFTHAGYNRSISLLINFKFFRARTLKIELSCNYFMKCFPVAL